MATELEIKPTLPPIRRDKEIEIKKMEIETVNRVISDADLKTQFSQTERIFITLLEEMAKNPFPISKSIADSRGIPYDTSRYGFKPLIELIVGYNRKGKALNRLGIGEDVKIVSAYFQKETELAKASQIKDKLMK